MTKRSIAMLAVLVLSPAIIEGLQPVNFIAAEAFESSNAATFRDQTASSDPRPVMWEYKILIGTVTKLVRYAGNDVRSGLFTLDIEAEINRFAAQGYVIDRFQVGAVTTDNGLPDIVVLLKRIRK